MSTQHTPGPWTLNTKTRSDMRITNGEKGFVIAEVTTGIARFIGNLSEAEANAQLIAAAPQLASDLVGIAKALIRVLDKYNPDSIEYEWISVANEAIFKATGLTLNEYQNNL